MGVKINLCTKQNGMGGYLQYILIHTNSFPLTLNSAHQRPWFFPTVDLFISGNIDGWDFQTEISSSDLSSYAAYFDSKKATVVYQFQNTNPKPSNRKPGKSPTNIHMNVGEIPLKLPKKNQSDIPTKKSLCSTLRRV